MVGLTEEVEALVTPVCFFDRLRDFNQLPHSIAWVIKRGDELQITAIRSFEQLGQKIKAINILLHRRYLIDLAPVVTLDFTVMLELGNVVCGRFNPQDDSKFVVHFDGDCTHLVLDSRAENACVEIVPNFALVVPMKFFQGTWHLFGGGWFPEKNKLDGVFKDSIKKGG